MGPIKAHSDQRPEPNAKCVAGGELNSGWPPGPGRSGLRAVHQAFQHHGLLTDDPAVAGGWPNMRRPTPNIASAESEDSRAGRYAQPARQGARTEARLTWVT